MNPSLIAKIIAFADQHDPACRVRYDAAADAVMTPEGIVSADGEYRIELHPCRTMGECRAALGY